MMSRKSQIAFTIFILLLGLVCLSIGYNFGKSESKDLSATLCDYSQDLTDIVNKQSDFINSLNLSEEFPPLRQLDKLDCEILK